MRYQIPFLSIEYLYKNIQKNVNKTIIDTVFNQHKLSDQIIMKKKCIIKPRIIQSKYEKQWKDKMHYHKLCRENKLHKMQRIIMSLIKQ